MCLSRSASLSLSTQDVSLCFFLTHPVHSLVEQTDLQGVLRVLEDGPERGPPPLVVQGPAAGDVALARGEVVADRVLHAAEAAATKVLQDGEK